MNTVKWAEIDSSQRGKSKLCNNTHCVHKHILVLAFLNKQITESATFIYSSRLMDPAQMKHHSMFELDF